MIEVNITENEYKRVKIEIEIDQKFACKLFDELKKNNLCINVGIMPLTPFIEVGQNILDIAIIQGRINE